MHHLLGTIPALDGDERPERHHVATRVACVQTPDLFRLRSELRLRLNIHLIRSAETIEVVDVERAEVDLERVEEVAELDAVGLGALTIDVGVDLRDAHLEARE